MKKRHKYDKELIEELCKKQPVDAFNLTDVAKKYCKKKGIDFSVYIARVIQQIVANSNLSISNVKPVKSVAYTAAVKRKFQSNKSNFIVTWAQAHTPIDENLWENIQQYAAFTNAEIIVMPGTYLNNNSVFTKRIEVWDSKLVDYLYATEANIHNHLIMIPDADIIPTAERPLLGLYNVTGIESCIIGHPRQHMDIIPTMKNSRRKFMFSTGSITIPNYRKSRVGKKAKVHHKMGFLFVENINDDNFVARHVHADDDGSFQDLIYSVSNGTVTIDKNWEAMIFGDTHLSKEDPVMLEESKRLCKLTNCKRTIWHDLADGYSINPHQEKDYVEQVIKAKKGLNSLEEEVNRSISFLSNWLEYNPIIIPSNHNDWIDKWVRFNRGAKDINNAIIFNKFQNILFEEKAPKGLYAYVLEEYFGDQITCLSRDDSYEVCGIELNNHGDLGSNGAKGTPRTFARLNTPVVSGDKHYPYTIDNAYGVGLSSVLDHKYNRGMSSWAQSNGIVLSNGRFQHLLYFDGKFTNLI
jgi:hypothetical protein